jgi:hypothetical protein
MTCTSLAVRVIKYQISPQISCGKTWAIATQRNHSYAEPEKFNHQSRHV